MFLFHLIGPGSEVHGRRYSRRGREFVLSWRLRWGLSASWTAHAGARAISVTNAQASTNAVGSYCHNREVSRAEASGAAQYPDNES